MKRAKKGTPAAAWFYGQSFHGGAASKLAEEIEWAQRARARGDVFRARLAEQAAVRAVNAARKEGR